MITQQFIRLKLTIGVTDDIEKRLTDFCNKIGMRDGEALEMLDIISDITDDAVKLHK